MTEQWRLDQLNNSTSLNTLDNLGYIIHELSGNFGPVNQDTVLLYKEQIAQRGLIDMRDVPLNREPINCFIGDCNTMITFPNLCLHFVYHHMDTVPIDIDFKQTISIHIPVDKFVFNQVVCPFLIILRNTAKKLCTGMFRNAVPVYVLISLANIPKSYHAVVPAEVYDPVWLIWLTGIDCPELNLKSLVKLEPAYTPSFERVYINKLFGISQTQSPTIVCETDIPIRLYEADFKQFTRDQETPLKLTITFI